jgi:hypothetical protein
MRDHRRVKPRKPLPSHLFVRPFTVPTGRASGLGRSRMLGSDLDRPFYGVRVRSGGELSAYQLCRAYSVTMADGAFFSHLTAARIWHVPLPTDFAAAEGVHVGTLAPRRAPRGRGVHGHQLTDPSALIVRRFGFPVVDPATMWCQLSSFLGLDDLVAAADHLVLTPRYVADSSDPRPWVGLDDLQTRVELFRGRGSRLLRTAIAQVRDGAESRPESILRLLIVRGGMPEPELNVDVFDAGGRFLGRADQLFREFRVIVEYDGDQHRTDSEQYDKDITRIDDFTAAGWTVVRVRKRGVFHDPDAGVNRVEAALRRAGWRP